MAPRLCELWRSGAGLDVFSGLSLKTRLQGQHPLVQDADDENAICALKVEHYMLFDIESTQARGKRIAAHSNQRIPNEQIEPFLQPRQVGIRLS